MANKGCAGVMAGLKERIYVNMLQEAVLPRERSLIAKNAKI
jgi:hypothetical protein